MRLLSLMQVSGALTVVPEFSPLDKASLALWLDGNDLAVGSATAWTDKSPNAMAFTSPGNTVETVAALNGKKAVYFPADNTSYFNSTAAGLMRNDTAYTIYCVGRNTRRVGGDTSTVLSLRPVAANSGISVLVGPAAAYGPVAWPADGTGWNARSNASATVTSFVDDVTFVFALGFDGADKAASTSYSATVNGVSGINGTTGGTYDSVPTTYWRIGQTQWGGAFGLKGYIAEVIVYLTAHSEAERNEILSYLTTKWGL